MQIKVSKFCDEFIEYLDSSKLPVILEATPYNNEEVCDAVFVTNEELLKHDLFIDDLEFSNEDELMGRWYFYKCEYELVNNV